LGLALANLVNLFNPAVVVLDARLEMAGPELLLQIARIVRMQALSYATTDLQFRFGKLGSSVGVLGAALLITEALFEIPVLKPPRFLLEREIQPPRSRGEHKIARTASRTA
jgi:predicted NBD/HSP70 family sugar kinase